MHVRIRIFGKPDTVVLVESKLTKIEQFRKIIQHKFEVEPELQRLFYGGKLLENGYTFHDYNIKLNDVIQLMVHKQPENIPKKNNIKASSTTEINENPNEEFKDAESTLYAVDDLIDMKDPELGAWFEGSITRIVYNPKLVPEVTDLDSDAENHEQSNSSDDSHSLDEKSSVENNPPSDLKTDDDSTVAKNKGITRYFRKIPKAAVTKKQNKKETSIKLYSTKSSDENLLYIVQLDEEDDNYYCKLNDIRPRARRVINIKDLKIGQKVMLNHNIDEPLETGYWYDFTVSEILKYRVQYKLIGTICLGADEVPQNIIKERVFDNIFAIEEAVPVKERTEEYKKLMLVQPKKRSLPLKCYTCRDDEETPCKNCGCYLCYGKEFPDKIVLCDDCNKGFHMICLTPPLMTLPDEDWYCPSCKRDPNEVVAPGAAKQTKKETKTNRDWGRGMACVGKTKSCSMPPNHFGPIPGIEVGMCWRFRIQLSETGVHRPPVSGIHGRDIEGAYSIVLSGGYEDDVDNGDEFTYTGSGGRDLSGNKRTAVQSCDQTLTRENKALARNCAIKQVTEQGGDAKDKWRDGKPVRVVRSYKMLKHFPKYAPKEGIRYDGIYKVVKYYPEVGLSGYRVWKYLLRRDDPSPAPWEPGAIEYPIIYPDGYLEAEAEKKALKKTIKKQKNKNTSKRPLRESNQSTDTESDVSPPVKKRKMRKNALAVEETSLSPTTNLANIFTKSPRSKKPSSESATVKSESMLTVEEKDAIKADSLNCKLWNECLTVCECRGKKEFVEHVSQIFLCIICQELAVNPVTTPCLHNFCMGCIKLAFKTTGAQSCPACRQSLTKYTPEVNVHLKAALRTILSGYDAGKK